MTHALRVKKFAFVTMNASYGHGMTQPGSYNPVVNNDTLYANR